MTAALILTLLTTRPDIGPMAPAGSSKFFQDNVLAVTEATSKGDFAAAERLMAPLPRRKVVVGYDDSKVPAGLKATFRKALDNAIEAFRAMPNIVTFAVGSGKPDVKISFGDDLGKDEDSGLPKGLAVIESPDRGDSPIEGILALHRTPQRVTVGDQLVRSDIVYVLLTYLGLARSPSPASAMARTDTLSAGLASVGRAEAQIASENLRIVDTLAEAVKGRKQLEVPKVVAHLIPDRADFGNIVQADPLMLTFELANLGNAPMDYRLVPDCSCFRTDQPGQIPAGGTRVVRVAINTRDFPGPFHKAVYLYTNDNDFPVRKIEFKGAIKPLCRLVPGDFGDKIYAQGDSVDATCYLYYDPSRPLQLDGVTLNGLDATSEVTPFQGDVADPEMKEGPMPRQGYKITFHIKTKGLIGATVVSVLAKTDSKVFPILTRAFQVQKGISVDPVSVYFGEIPKKPTTAFTILTSPKRPMKVKSAKCDTQGFTADVEELGDGSYKLDLTYDGSGAAGFISGTVKVLTDDPDQPEISIPFSATVI